MTDTNDTEAAKVPVILARVQELTDRALLEVPHPRILEAGCGVFSRVIRRPNWHIVGIDISQEQLDRNSCLSEKILGDIQTFPLARESFNMIASWWVLEHLPNPQRALVNFAQALAPGGILVLAFPNPLSFKGMITKLSPHWFHVWVYRRIFKQSYAETDGHALFKTYMRLAISPGRIRRFAVDHALGFELFETYESLYQTRLYSKSRLMYWLLRMLRRFILTMSYGSIDIRQTECICVLRRGTRSSP